MKTKTLLILVIIFSLAAFPAMAMQGSDMNMKSDDNMTHGDNGMQMDHSAMGGMFKY
jgi:hypothetical protein